MVALYGAGAQGQQIRVTEELSKVLKKKSIPFATRAEQRGVTKLLDTKIKEAEQLGAIDTAAELRAMKSEVLELAARNPSVDGAALLAEAESFHPQVADFVRKYTDNYNGTVVPPQAFVEITKILSEKMTQFAPVGDRYIDYWKRVGAAYARETGKTRIPWVTFDKKTLWQDYRPKVQTELRFFDPASKRYIRNIYQQETPEGKVYGKADIGDTRRGLAVNGNHACQGCG